MKVEKSGAIAPIQKENRNMEDKISVVNAQTPAFEFTPVGLKLKRALTVVDVSETLRGVRDGREQFEWVVGDAVLYGVEAFGEKTLKEIASNLKLDYGTMRTRKWVSQNVPLSLRVATLSWRHHREVASCLTLESKQGWLKLAIDKGWSARELAKEIAAAKQTEVKPKTTDCKTAMKQIQRVVTEVVTSWDQWSAEERSALNAELQKLGTIITQDSTGNLVMLKPVEMPAVFTASARAVAEAVKPEQVLAEAASAPVKQA